MTVELHVAFVLGYGTMPGHLRPEQDRRTVPQRTRQPRYDHEHDGASRRHEDAVLDRPGDAPVPVEADEGHVPGGRQGNDVVEEDEDETPGPTEAPAAQQDVGRVDADQESDDQVGYGEVQDEVVAERAQLLVGDERSDDKSVSGDRCQGDDPYDDDEDDDDDD